MPMMWCWWITFGVSRCRPVDPTRSSRQTTASGSSRSIRRCWRLASWPDQKLKTDNSARLIPIHSAVLEAGFLAFVQGRAGGRLFTELPHRQDGYSHLWGQWFSRNRPVPKDFHSLRHTVGTTLKDQGVPLQFAAAILGHANGAISYDRYGGPLKLPCSLHSCRCRKTGRMGSAGSAEILAF